MEPPRTNAARKTLYLCGATNSEAVRLALTIQRREQRWDRIALLDDDPALHGREVLSVPVAGPFRLLGQADPAASEVANLVGRTTARRWAAQQRIESYGLSCASLIHPDVDTWGAEFGRNVIVYAHATISPDVILGESSVVFMGAVVGHETRVGRCCVVAAGAVLNARVVLEDRVYVGSNASILPELRIGAGATVGAGSSVCDHVPAGATAVGVPARVLQAADAGVDLALESESAPPEEPRAPANAQSASELEPRIARLWGEFFGRSPIDRDANFFDLGGTSLLAIRLQRRIELELGRVVPLTDLFCHTSVRTLARHLALAPGAIPPSSDGTRGTDGFGLRADLRQAFQRRRRT